MAAKAAIVSRRKFFASVQSLGDADGPHRPSLQRRTGSAF